MNLSAFQSSEGEVLSEGLIASYDGKLYTKDYTCVDGGQLEACSSFPDPLEYDSYAEFSNAVQAWQEEMERIFDNVIMPVNSLSTFHRPLSKHSNLSANNLNYLYQRTLSGIEIDRVEILPEADRTRRIPLSKHLKEHDTRLVMMAPIPEMYDTEEEFIEASVRWYDAHSQMVKPHHPEQLETVLCLTKDNHEGVVVEDPDVKFGELLQPEKLMDSHKLSVLLFSMRVSQGTMRPIRIRDFLRPDTPDHYREAFTKYVDEYIEYGDRINEKDGRVMKNSLMRTLAKTFQRPYKPHITAKQFLFYLQQLGTVRSLAVKHELYVQLPRYLATCDFAQLCDGILSKIDLLLEITDMISTFDGNSNTIINMIREIGDPHQCSDNPTLVQTYEAFVRQRLCAIFVDVLPSSRKKNPFFGAAQRQLDIFLSIQEEISHCISDSLNAKSAKLCAMIVVFMLESGARIEEFIKMFKNLFFLLDSIAKVSAEAFALISQRVLLSKNMITVIYPSLITLLIDGPSMEFMNMDPPVLNFITHLLQLSAKGVPPKLAFTWLMPAISSFMPVCTSDRIGMLIDALCGLCVTVYPTAFSRWKVKTFAEDLFSVFADYLKNSSWTSPLLLHSFGKMLNIKKFREHIDKGPDRFDTILNHMASKDMTIRIAAWKVFKKWFLLSYLSMHAKFKRPEFKKKLVDAMAKPMTDIAPIIMELIMRYSETHIPIDTAGDQEEAIESTFIFLYSGVPIELVELASQFKVAKFKIGRYMWKLGADDPNRNQKAYQIACQFKKVLKKRNAVRRLLDLQNL